MKYIHVSMFISEKFAEEIRKAVYLDKDGCECFDTCTAQDCLIKLHERLTDGDEDCSTGNSVE